MYLLPLALLFLAYSLPSHADYRELLREKEAYERATEPARQAAAQAEFRVYSQRAFRNAILFFASRHCGLDGAPSAPRRESEYKSFIDFRTRDGFECELEDFHQFKCVQRGTYRTDALSLGAGTFEEMAQAKYRVPKTLCPGPGFRILER